MTVNYGKRKDCVGMVEITEELQAKIDELNESVEAIKKEIDSLYMELGKYTYEMNTPNRDVLIGDTYNKLNEKYAMIRDVNVKILDIKGYKICPSCGLEVDKELMYCGNCGTKMKTEVETTAEGNVCTKCGAVMEPDKKFCTRCGAKMEMPAPKEPAAPICPNCGKILKPGAGFCSGCGTKLN